MTKESCTREEFEQFKAIHDNFSFFYDPKPNISDSEYSFRKTDLILEFKDFWMIFQRLCKELGILLEIDSQSFIGYAANKNFFKHIPFSKKSLDLDIFEITIERCIKSGQPKVNMWKTPYVNAAEKEAWELNQQIMQQIKKIFDELLISLRKRFGKKSGAKASYKKPAGTGGKIEPKEKDEQSGGDISGMSGQEAQKKDDELPVRISVIIKRGKVVVSQSAIKQAVIAGDITDFREKEGSPHLVLESEVIKYFSEHGQK